MRPRNLRGLCVLGWIVLWSLGCRAPQTLVATLPESTSTLTVRTRVEQPFYSARDGLTAVRLRLNLPDNFAPGERPSLGGGGTIRIVYAPEVDPRYPDSDFYAWPASQGWIGELLPGRVISQRFLSRYPNLDGITVRVGTYGADVGTGIGRLREDVSAIVREAPIAGREITALPGGGAVEVIGSREGWVRVRLTDGRVGYIDRASFADLPAPRRENWGELLLRLYREGEDVPLREARLSVQDLADESHVTFRFAPIPESYRAVFRFTIEAVGSAPGHAVTVWSDPQAETLVFRPTYATQVLAEASLDAGRWSGVEGTLEVRFSPIQPTRDVYLRLIVEAKERPLIVHWSMVRPPGNLPLASRDDPGIWGGLVFNARYSETVPIGWLVRTILVRAIRAIVSDPVLGIGYMLVTIGALGLLAWSWRKRGRRAVVS